MAGGHERYESMEFRKRVHDRITNLQRRVLECSSRALEKVFHERMDTYFAQEERLEEMEQVLHHLVLEVDQSDQLRSLRRISDRLDFLEDHFDDIESVLYNRPARPRRDRFNFFQFFRKWTSQSAQDGSREIHSESQACRELGIEDGANLKNIKKAFRQMIKDLHPDQRNGDRSTEPRLRRLVEAYDFLRKRR